MDVEETKIDFGANPQPLPPLRTPPSVRHKEKIALGEDQIDTEKQRFQEVSEKHELHAVSEPQDTRDDLLTTINIGITRILKLRDSDAIHKLHTRRRIF